MATRKTSKKRQAILDALMATTEHPNAEWLYHKLKPEYPDLSLGTVYRNLAALSAAGKVYRNLSLFADAGDILRIGVLGGQERFDGRTDPHAHLLCAECGRVMDVETPELEPKLCALAQSASGAEVRTCTLTFTGVCPDCRRPGSSPASE